MLSFEQSWIFYLLPLPLLAWRLIPAAKQQQAALRVPFFNSLDEAHQTTSTTAKGKGKKISALLLCWLGLIAAAAAPKWLEEPVTLPNSGRDLLLAVDLSGSMSTEDMQIRNQRASRLDTVKMVLADFIERRKGDRLGLVLFGEQAYIQAPLTFDRKTVQQFLTEAQIGFAGEKQTAIGDAIGLSIKRLKDRAGDRHVMILLTDGQNNSGEVKPIPAAKLAAENNIVIYTVGVGADRMQTRGMFGSRFGSRTVNPSAELDEETLQEIATLTGGQYFRARNPEQLLQIYQLLDELEPVEDELQTFRPQRSLFYWPLGVALLLSALLVISQLSWRNAISTTGERRA